MILPLSAAANLYWLGRYFVRVDGLSHLYFSDDLEAQTFSHAFNLPAWNAETLNGLIHDPSQSGSLPANLNAVEQNIQSVQGVLSTASFEVFNALYASQKTQFVNMSALLQSCRDAIKHESQDVQLFFRMGESLERIDINLRMSKDPSQEIAVFCDVLDSLPIGWQHLKEPMMLLNDNADRIAFYDLSDRIQELFKKGV